MSTPLNIAGVAIIADDEDTGRVLLEEAAAAASLKSSLYRRTVRGPDLGMSTLPTR